MCCSRRVQGHTHPRAGYRANKADDLLRARLQTSLGESGSVFIGCCGVLMPCNTPSFLGSTTPEENTEMERLCRLIQEEKDHKKFVDLIDQLNSLLTHKESRLYAQLQADRKSPTEKRRAAKDTG